MSPTSTTSNQEPVKRVDLAVVGSGGAAFAAAIAARRRDLDVVLIERATVGGTCVNTGCVPSKALLAAAEARHRAVEARFPGIDTHADTVRAATLFADVRALVGGLRMAKYSDLAAEHGFTILTGRAGFVDDPAYGTAVRVRTAIGATLVTAEHYLVATGSAPAAPPIPGLADAGYLTSTTAVDLDAVPESMAVLGAGSVGLEQAQLFARLGSRVTLLTRSRPASREEPEISAGIEEAFTGDGITVHPSTTLDAVRRDDTGYHLTGTRHGQRVSVAAEALLVATGRHPVTAGLNLAEVGVKTGTGGEVLVDDRLRTDNPRIWAAGDVTGHPQFVYVAGAHGALVVDNAFAGADRVVDYAHLPHVTFTSPAIASVGMTEAQAVESGVDGDRRVLPLGYVPRAIVDRDTRGLVKLVAERTTGRLLGAHVLATGAGEVIAIATTALAQRMTVRQLAEQWCPYLTMAEGLKLAALAFTHDVSTLSCCAT